MAGDKTYASRGNLWVSRRNGDGSVGLQLKLAEIPGFKLSLTNERGEVITVAADGVAGHADGIIRSQITFKEAQPKPGQGGRPVPLDQYLLENANLAVTASWDNGQGYVIPMVVKKVEWDFELGKPILKDCELNGGKPQPVDDLI